MTVMRKVLFFLPVLMFLTALFANARAEENPFAMGWQAYQQGDFVTARKYWQPLAEGGNALAQYNMGVLYAEGRGVPADRARAMAWWRQAAKGGYLAASHNLALALIEEASLKGNRAAAAEALRLLRRAADGGLVRSQYSLAQMYAYGLGVERNDAIARRLLEKAAVSGLAAAQYNLAKFLRDGRGGPRDLAAAAAWFEKAALQGHVRAQSRLAVRYARGEGVRRDPVTALAWATLAAGEGEELAAENVKALRRSLSPAAIAAADAKAARLRDRIAASRKML